MSEEYISREAAKEEMCSRCYDSALCYRSDDDCPIKRGLNSIPAADVRPVVTCGECRKCATDECHFFAHGEWGMSGLDYWFYCADGERRAE